MTRRHLAFLLVPLAVALLASLRGTVPAREPEIPADLMVPPEDGFTGIAEESPPPVMVTFAPNCQQHDGCGTA